MTQPEAISETNNKIDGIDKYKVESAADTLIRAEEVKLDKKLLAAARKVINKRMEAINNI